MERVDRFTQAYSQMPWRKQVQGLGLFLLGLVFTALLAGVFLSIDARTATTGEEIITTQDDIADLDREIADLQSHLAFLTSTSEMEKRAADLGYIPMSAEQITYLVVSGYSNRQPAGQAQPGANRRENIHAVAETALPAEYTESFFVWLGKHVLPLVLPGWEGSK